MSLQLEQERRKSNGLAQALQQVKEQHFTTQQQVTMLSVTCLLCMWPSSSCTSGTICQVPNMVLYLDA